MSANISRTYTFTDGTTAAGSQVEVEIAAIVNMINNLDAGTTKWSVVSASNASAVPLIADNGAGTNDIVNFKDNGSTVLQLADGGNLTLATGNLIFSASGKGITGTTTNDDAAAGNVGQEITSSATNVAAPTSTEYKDATSISLPAGDWLIRFGAQAEVSGAVWSAIVIGVSTTSGNSATGLVGGDSRASHSWANSSTTPTVVSAAGITRMKLASTTTVYFKFSATYSSGTPQLGNVFMAAKRMR